MVFTFVPALDTNRHTNEFKISQQPHTDPSQPARNPLRFLSTSGRSKGFIGFTACNVCQADEDICPHAIVDDEVITVKPFTRH